MTNREAYDKGFRDMQQAFGKIATSCKSMPWHSVIFTNNIEEIEGYDPPKDEGDEPKEK